MKSTFSARVAEQRRARAHLHATTKRSKLYNIDEALHDEDIMPCTIQMWPPLFGFTVALSYRGKA